MLILTSPNMHPHPVPTYLPIHICHMTWGLFGCEILFHDACAVREFGMRDEVRHSAAPRVWRHDIIFCQNVAWRIFVMRAALLVKCGAGYRSTLGGKWRIRRLHNIMPKCSAKYFAVRMGVTLYVVWGHIQQNIISQPNRPLVLDWSWSEQRARWEQVGTYLGPSWG